ncbi:hypothetical protein NIES3275_33330 [Microchaete diplosiphon NIES-3275]|nr:hypothetical protein NIES3275_33330 [Microchaete diplosiphon NIES-3275]
MVGVGLCAAGIGASTAPYIIPQQPTKPILPPFMTNPLHPYLISPGTLPHIPTCSSQPAPQHQH